MQVIDSKADLIADFQSQGGISYGPTQMGGAGLYVSGDSTVNIWGGSLGGGLNFVNSDLNGPSIVVHGAESIVHVHKGTFSGEWVLQSGGKIAVHACHFSYDDKVHATLADGTRIDVPFIIEDGRGTLTSILVKEGCDKSPSQNTNAHLPSDISALLPSEDSKNYPTETVSTAASAPSPSPTKDTSYFHFGHPSIPGSKEASTASPIAFDRLGHSSEDAAASANNIVTDTVNLASKENSGDIRYIYFQNFFVGYLMGAFLRL